MMKPYLVKEIQQFGQTIDKNPPTVIKRRIASRSTIKNAQELIKKVLWKEERLIS